MTNVSRLEFCQKYLKINMCIHYRIIAGQCPKRSCGQGEGDCDRDSDCLDGLVCDFDWWWGDDYCKAGMSCSLQMLDKS